jgi:hypothetical protein
MVRAVGRSFNRFALLLQLIPPRFIPLESSRRSADDDVALNQHQMAVMLQKSNMTDNSACTWLGSQNLFIDRNPLAK